MAHEKEDFYRSGPSFLTNPDWKNQHHRRSIVASLVKGVYIMESDRKQNRQGPQALAPPWWQFFHFRLNQVLIDSHDQSYFGAIYEFDFPNQTHLGQRPPQYVIAFRGTIKKCGNIIQDSKLNLNYRINKLHKRSRFQIGFESVYKKVHSAGPGNSWLAGHSLGASIALLIGRHMVQQENIHLETYLFNPPFISLPIGLIKNDKLKSKLRLAKSIVTASLAAAVNGGQSSEDLFMVLSTWIPHLFINPSDPICSEYEGYFGHREKMESTGAGNIERLATRHSIGSIFLSAATGKDPEAAHLIPSAYLTINLSPSQDCKEVHGIRQWWRADLELKHETYQCK